MGKFLKMAIFGHWSQNWSIAKLELAKLENYLYLEGVGAQAAPPPPRCLELHPGTPCPYKLEAKSIHNDKSAQVNIEAVFIQSNHI